jgi:predicted dehydrogenase
MVNGAPISANKLRLSITGKTIPMTAPDQVLLSGVLQNGAVVSVHLKGGTTNATRFLLEIHGTEGALAIVPADPRQETYIQVSEFTVRGAQGRNQLADLSMPEATAGFPPRPRPGFRSTSRSYTGGWLRAFAKESPSARISIWPSTVTSCST